MKKIYTKYLDTLSAGGLVVSFPPPGGPLPTPATATTDVNGIATLSLTAPTSLGSATVTAAVASFSATTTVTFVAGVPNTIQLSATPATVNVGGTATLTATVLDAQGNPEAGQTLTFTPLPTHGTLSVTSGVTDSNGRLTVTYTGTSRSEERRVGKERRSRWSPYH